MISFRHLLPLIGLTLCALPASAADVVYPLGSRVGLAPPEGMTLSTTFQGFEDKANKTSLGLVAFPAEAYAELEKTITADALKKQGIVVDTREDVTLPSGKGFLVVGRQEVDQTRIRKWLMFTSFPTLTVLTNLQIPDAAKAAYPDAKIREALRTVAVRATVPAEEQLLLFPLKVGNLAGFGVVSVIPGRALMLGDAKPDAPPTASEPHMIIALDSSEPVSTADRDQFAREVFANVPNLKAKRVTGAEPLRFGGQQGHQIFASAQEPTTGAGLSIVQWLRFGGAGYMQILGVARTEAWPAAYPRFREVRDGLEPK